MTDYLICCPSHIVIPWHSPSTPQVANYLCGGGPATNRW